MDIAVGGTPLRLLPQHAVHLPEHDLLLVADLHLGKAAAFRRQGLPVPENTTDDTLARLSDALALSGAMHLVVLGDLLHSAAARAPATLEAVARWRRRHAALRLTLVRGNHDLRAGDPPADWRVQVVDGPLPLAGCALALRHEPGPATDDAYVLCGHVHPAAALAGRAHQRLRLPCFHFGARCGVLPAFGAFTGMHVLPRGPQDRVYVVVDGQVRALNSVP